jgi:transcriptional regulator with XRE-family HTH domain
MNREDRDRLLAELLEAPGKRAEILRAAQIDDHDQVDIASLAEIADLLWAAAHGAPPLEEDPVAAMLGLVPDPQYTLDPKALTRARKQAGLAVSQVAERLRARGWSVPPGDVFRWETRSASDVPPALVQALAEVIGTQVDRLIAVARTNSITDDLRQHPVFQQLAERWARARQLPIPVAAAELIRRAAATVHRGDRPDEEQMLGSIAALVAAVEQEGTSERDEPG